MLIKVRERKPWHPAVGVSLILGCEGRSSYLVPGLPLTLWVNSNKWHTPWVWLSYVFDLMMK